MSVLGAMVRYEALLQWRSLRLRLGVVLYWALGSLPALLVFLDRHRSLYDYGIGSFVRETSAVHPFLSVLLALVVTGNLARFDAAMESVLGPSPLTHLGFLLRKWLVAVVLVVPLTLGPALVPVLLATAAGAPVTDLGVVLWPWLLLVVPVTVTACAFWLGAVTILRSEIAAFLVSLMGSQLLLNGLNQVLLYFSVRLAGTGAWTRSDMFSRWFSVTLYRITGSLPADLVASDAPYDPGHTVHWLWPRALLGLGATLCVLGTATAFLGRTRRDLPPPGETFRRLSPNAQRILRRLRERYLPDAGLSLWDRLAVVAGVVALLVSLGLLLHRARTFTALARERYRVERADPVKPQSPEIVPGRWRLGGRVFAHGAVELRVEGSLRNLGSTARDHLAFALDPSLTLGGIAAEGRRLSVERHWDRLSVDLDPPLAPGDETTLAVELRGTPARYYFPLLGLGNASFATRFAGFERARFSRGLSDLSRSQVRRSFSPRRVRLASTQLTPVPRFTPWTLTPPPSSLGDSGNEVPAEALHPEVELELDLTVPPGWFLADTCGHLTSSEGRVMRLRGSCRVALLQLELLGGAMEPLEVSSSPLTLAALPAHRVQARQILGALSQAASRSTEVWPGLAGLVGMVALEWPPELGQPLVPRGFDSPPPQPELRGRLLLLPEGLVLHRRPVDAPELAARALSHELLQRRPVVPAQGFVVRRLVETLLLQRLGVSRPLGATLSGPRWAGSLTRPLLEAAAWDEPVWRHRLPAVLIDMEHRVGWRNLKSGIEAFFADSEAGRGDVAKLLAEVEKASGVSLARMYADYFAGDALPEMRLEDLETRRLGRRWQVTGELLNVGSGEAVCPLVVKTEIESVETVVTVEEKGATPFTIETLERPETLLLDPQRVCLRYVSRAPKERFSLDRRSTG